MSQAFYQKYASLFTCYTYLLLESFLLKLWWKYQSLEKQNVLKLRYTVKIIILMGMKITRYILYNTIIRTIHLLVHLSWTYMHKLWNVYVLSITETTLTNLHNTKWQIIQFIKYFVKKLDNMKVQCTVVSLLHFKLSCRQINTTAQVFFNEPISATFCCILLTYISLTVHILTAYYPYHGQKYHILTLN